MKQPKQTINRRHFLKATALTATAMGMSARSYSQVAGSNSDVRCAVVGINGRGGSHLEGFKDLEGVRVVALCDADRNVLDRRNRGLNVPTYLDMRKLFEDKDVDVISIATPNHWHALAAIWAIQAGKDVYLEKPVSHNVSEGRRIVEFARKEKKMVQTGTQSRSSRDGIQEAIDWLNEGHLGKIKIGRGLCYKPRGSIGKVDGPQPIPPGINYDLWCGPAEFLPLTRKNLHYDWHWVWNTGNGDLGNQGIHQMDIARWFLGEPELAPRVWSVGGRLGYDDDGETPNTMVVFQDYAKAPLIFEVRGLPEKKGAKEMPKYRGARVGVVIECEDGSIVVPSYSSSVAYDKDGKELKKFNGGGNHFENFIKAVRSRKHTDLNADILEGHLSSALCHTGNVSYRLGHLNNPEQVLEKIKADRGAEDSFQRMLEHLEANEVDLTKDQVRLGPPLTLDPASEEFVNDPIANSMITRNYREPFVVPDKV